ncbi:MAG TPA: hypothetical protein VGF14_01725 [Alphaproteobacteria bacterium]
MTKQSTSVAKALDETAVFDGFFAALADQDLATLSLEHVAKAGKLPLAALRHHYPSLGHILNAFSQSLNRQMQAAISYDTQDSKRDIYFDLLMTRLDALQPYRDGMKNLLKQLPSRPDLALIQARAFQHGIDAMIEAADDFYPSWQVPFKKTGLAALYTRILYAWRKDDSTDLAKTMAVLDKALERTEHWIGKIPKIA